MSEGLHMKKYLGITAALAASVAVTGCATTNPYGYNDPYYSGQQDPNTRNAATGAIGGAAAGAVLGAVVPGVSTVEGAVAGAVLGGVLGAVVKGRQYYRDTRGYCYYVDQYGRPIYDYNTRC
jgi:outer membrane lipoprotein SlyB